MVFGFEINTKSTNEMGVSSDRFSTGQRWCETAFCHHVSL